MEFRETVAKYTITMLRFAILDKVVNLYSPCKCFPNYDVTGKVIQVKEDMGSPIITLILNSNGEKIDIKGSIANLTFAIRNN